MGETIIFIMVSKRTSIRPRNTIRYITKNNAISIDEYKSMVKFLSTELGVKVKAFEALSSTHPWLSLNHGDSQVTQAECRKPLGKCHLFAFVRWWFVLGA
jgi:hypothetical protein